MDLVSPAPFKRGFKMTTLRHRRLFPVKRRTPGQKLCSAPYSEKFSMNRNIAQKCRNESTQPILCLNLNIRGIFLFSFRPPPGLLPVLGSLKRYMTPTPDTALLIGSGVGADLGQT